MHLPRGYFYNSLMRSNRIVQPNNAQKGLILNLQAIRFDSELFCFNMYFYTQTKINDIEVLFANKFRLIVALKAYM